MGRAEEKAWEWREEQEVAATAVARLLRGVRDTTTLQHYLETDKHAAPPSRLHLIYRESSAERQLESSFASALNLRLR